MHAKYQVAIFNIANVMSKVKVLGQNDRQAKNNIPLVFKGAYKLYVNLHLQTWCHSGPVASAKAFVVCMPPRRGRHEVLDLSFHLSLRTSRGLCFELVNNWMDLT